MCQTSLISRNIARASTRSFEQNLEVVSGIGVTDTKLKRLNNALDAIYELIYSQFNEIDSEDYRIIGPQLGLLLNTLKGLCSTYKKIRTAGNLTQEVAALRRNYSALYELNSDIKHFRIKQKRNINLANAVDRAMKQL